MASNYKRGYATEYRIAQHFKEHGIWAIRSPASKGLFDIAAIDRSGVYLIQAKRTKRKKITPSMYGDEIERIQAWMRTLPQPLPRWFHVQFWIWVDRQGFTKLEIKPTLIKVLEGDISW